MNSADVHPELREAARKMPQMTFSLKNLWLIRPLIGMLNWGSKLPAGVRVKNTAIPSRDQKTKIRLRIYTPASVAPKAPALLWMHGGGYIAGTPEQDDTYLIPFLQETGMVIVSVDYRLAPEHPFPAPLEDCYSALQWLTAQAETLGVDPQRIAIGGDSAGGGLAAGLAQLAHDRGEIRPAFQLLVYPMLDDRTAARPDTEPQSRLGWNNASNRFGWESYLGQPCGAASAPAGSVPARRPDLSGLPPAWIGVGTLDLFYAEDVEYARRLNEAGVPCQMVSVPGAFHGFDVGVPLVPVVKDFRQSQVQALKKV